MTNVDQFESTFRSAAKEVYKHQPIDIARVLVVTDLEEPAANALTDRLRSFLGCLAVPDEAWTTLHGDVGQDIETLLNITNEASADLVCTYRHLYGDGWKWSYSLGDHLSVLTQHTNVPVLVVPHPSREADQDLGQPNTVMAITDHLTGDHRLVNWAARFVCPGGHLALTHVEDAACFERYVDVISKIPSVDTEDAAEAIRAQLMKEPADFVASCRGGLKEASLDLTVREIVSLGHHLREHTRLIEDENVDLAVFNTKDDDQLAMHGLAYPIAVELRSIPLLML